MEETIKYIDKYIEGMENETASQLYKPFFTLYTKKRHWLNPFRYIFGEYKYRWFEEGKQPAEYKNAFELFTDSIDIDIKDISFTKSDSTPK